MEPDISFPRVCRALSLPHNILDTVQFSCLCWIRLKRYSPFSIVLIFAVNDSFRYTDSLLLPSFPQFLGDADFKLNLTTRLNGIGQ